MLEPIFSSPRLRVTAHRSLVVSFFHKMTETEDLDGMAVAERELLRQYPRISTLSLIRLRELKLQPGIREKSEALQREFGPFSLAQANVVIGEGFAAVVMRSLLGGLNLLLRGEARSKTFAAYPEALDWLVAQPGQDPELVTDKDALLDAIRVSCDELAYFDP